MQSLSFMRMLLRERKRKGNFRTLDFRENLWLETKGLIPSRFFSFVLRGGLFGGKFCSRFICPLSLLDREVGLIAEWNMEVQRRRFVPGNIFSIKEECSPISRYRCVPLIALASVFNIFSMESRLLFLPLPFSNTIPRGYSISDPIKPYTYYYRTKRKSADHFVSNIEHYFSFLDVYLVPYFFTIYCHLSL